MARLPGARIFGVETEFGCLVRSESRPEDAVELIKDAVFYDFRLGLIDIHARDEVFEPEASGGFLLNGGRLYIDAVGSHLEYATAECQTLKDLVANDRAGQRIIQRAIKELGLADEVDVYNNSVDHFGGHTFGCHENYLVRMEDDFFTRKAPLLYPFLVTRQIFAGVGRVGGHVLVGGLGPTHQEITANPIDFIWVSNIYSAIPDDSVEYQLSQRADHILKTVAGRVRFNRALINPKWEHFYAHEGMHRLHILFGEPNQSEYAYALKIGTTHLVLRLLEDELLGHEMALASPLRTLREVSRDASHKWVVTLADGSTMGAIDLQREHLALASRYRGESEQTDWILDEWESVLDGLESDPLALGDRLDWVAKRKVLEMFIESEGHAWGDDALQSIDMEYHNTDPEKSLFEAWRGINGMRRVCSDLDIVDAMTDPPVNTRAKGRSELIAQILNAKRPRGYGIDWSAVVIGDGEYHDLVDPFETYSL
jgi:proteasome accessory factor A